MAGEHSRARPAPRRGRNESAGPFVHTPEPRFPRLETTVPHPRPRRNALIAALALAWAAAWPGAAHASPKELGAVQWIRDYDEGIRQARASDRPVFLLFQEVPGCATCVGFGEEVLSHPLLVEAIETEFVPVAIFNNKGGKDRAVLKRFREPSWNNPVVRFVDADGRDLIDRAAGVWSPGGIAERMVSSLERASRPVPAYLQLALAETRAHRTETATFEMHCFWEGEGCLGALPGVVSTEAGWLEGREVVQVHFDPKVTSYAELLRRARAGRCAEAVFVREPARLEAARAAWGDRARSSAKRPRAARDSDQKRYLRATPLAKLDLTPLQQTRVNAALANGQDPLRWLSPRQRARVQ